MPRKARIDAPGALHHIIVRGIERRRIFSDDKDRDNFVDRLGDIVTETQTFCFSWALIPNHAHLLLRTGKTSLSPALNLFGKSGSRIRDLAMETKSVRFDLTAFSIKVFERIPPTVMMGREIFSFALAAVSRLYPS